MKTKSGVAQNDEVNQRTETSDIPEMSEIDKAACEKIQQLQDVTFHQSAKSYRAEMAKHRLQFGDHGGSNVFFNRNGKDYRYSLTDGVTGTMYVADSPLTAMKEVFQNKKGLKESELDNFYLGTVVIEKDIKVVDVTALVRHSSLTLVVMPGWHTNHRNEVIGMSTKNRTWTLWQTRIPTAKAFWFSSQHRCSCPVTV